MACNKSYIFSEEELICPICFEEFNFDDKNKYPYLLLCLHTFCSCCLKELHKADETIVCPLCRKLHIVSKIDDLMDNYAIHDYLRMKLIKDDEILAKKLQKDEAIFLSLNRLVHEDEILAKKLQLENDALLSHLNRPRPEFCHGVDTMTRQVQNSDAASPSLNRPRPEFCHGVNRQFQNSDAASSSLSTRSAPYLQCIVVDTSQSSAIENEQRSSFQLDQEGDAVNDVRHSSTSAAVEEGNESGNHPPSTESTSDLRDDPNPQLTQKNYNIKRIDADKATCIENTLIWKQKQYNLRSYTSRSLENNADVGPQPSTSSQATPHVALSQSKPKRKYVMKKANTAHSLVEEKNKGTTLPRNTPGLSVPKRKYVKKRANAPGSQESNADYSTQSLASSSLVTEHVVEDLDTDPKKKTIKKRIKNSTPANDKYNIKTKSSPMANSSFEVSINSSPRYNRIKERIETRLPLMMQLYAGISATDVPILLSDESDSLIQSPHNDTVLLSDDGED